MYVTALPDDLSPQHKADQRVYLHQISWEDYEQLLSIRGECAGPRITYLEGVLELMSPSIAHEACKTTVGRLVEAYADERELDLIGYGSWTIRKKLQERGLEPDECYVLGTHEPERPDLAIEVIWTSGGIDKLEVYRGLGVPEVWLVKNMRIHVYELRNEQYVQVEGSLLLPALDLELIARYLAHPNQAQAARAYRRWLRDHPDH